MKIDVNKVKKVIEKIKELEEKEKKTFFRKNTLSNNRLKLKELLGGEKLDEIFDYNAINSLLDNVIQQGKVHNMLDEVSDFNVLENLLNNNVEGDLSNFYTIKPEYILQLSEEQRQKMAKSIAGEDKDLSKSLQNLWNKGIGTEACTTKEIHGKPMIQIKVKDDDYENQQYLQGIYEQEGVTAFGQFHYYEENVFRLNLIGDDLYTLAQQEKFEKTACEKENIFEVSVEENIQFLQEMKDSYLKAGLDIKKVEEDLRKEKKLKIDLNEKRQSMNTKSNPWELKPEQKEKALENTKKLTKEFNGARDNQQQTQVMDKQERFNEVGEEHDI